MDTVSDITEDENSVEHQESPFAFEELFFSRTDDRGVIQAGNNVFKRVSAYDWDVLLNAPHRVIRHPDMPKAVFWLLWDCIKRGEPIGAYVKNKSKDGRYYWVYAVVTPIEGGYSSVRMKPSSDLFEVVQREYAALRLVENEQKLDAGESAKVLLERIKELGFRNYNSFMSHCLAAEIKARNEILGRDRDVDIRHFDKLQASAKYLLDKSAKIRNTYMQHEYVPLNLLIQATQLGDIGLPMCIVSDNYTALSDELESDMAVFTEKSQAVAQTIDNGLFLTASAQIQGEMIEAFSKEVEEGSSQFASDLDNLQSQQKVHSANAAVSLVEISRQIIEFAENCTDMRRLSTSLEVIRVMGKIESASLDSSITNLDVLIDDLGVFQKELMDGLKEIDSANKSLSSDVVQLMKAA